MSKTIEQLKSRASILLLQPYQTNQLVDEMCQVGWQLRHFDSDLACRLSEKASKIAVRNDYLRGRAFALVNIGWCQYYTDHYAQARLSFEESRQIFVRLQEDAGLAAALNALGALLKISGDFENAIEHHQDALNLYKKLGEHSKTPILQMNFGTIYVRSADFSQALEHFCQGLAAAKTEQPMAQAWIKNCLSDALWGLFIFYLPSYSPHLNLAETVWRKLKYKWLSAADYACKEQLQCSVKQVLWAFGKSLRINFSDFKTI